MRAIQEIVDQQQREFGQLFREEIIPALAKAKILLVQDEAFDEKGKAFAKVYFKENVAPLLKPFPLKGNQKTPFLKDKCLYFIVQFKEENTTPQILEIPSNELSRFVKLPKTNKDIQSLFWMISSVSIFHNILVIKKLKVFFLLKSPAMPNCILMMNSQVI